MTAIIVSYLVALGVNTVFFVIAAIRKTDVVTDLSYSLSFAVLALVLPFLGAHKPVQLIAALMVLLWAFRLGGYLFGRILQDRPPLRRDAQPPASLR